MPITAPKDTAERTFDDGIREEDTYDRFVRKGQI
jgi:hypothetical protein